MTKTFLLVRDFPHKIYCLIQISKFTSQIVTYHYHFIVFQWILYDKVIMIKTITLIVITLSLSLYVINLLMTKVTESKPFDKWMEYNGIKFFKV